MATTKPSAPTSSTSSTSSESLAELNARAAEAGAKVTTAEARGGSSGLVDVTVSDTSAS